MSKYDCVIYDFDGVVLDSVQLKIDAFCEVYADEQPKRIDAVRTFAEANGGMSRFEKFRYFEVSVFGRSDDPETIDALCAAYGRFVDDGVSKAAYIKGAPDCFKDIRPFAEQHIVSAAPEKDVLTALRQREIQDFFRSVSGAPKAKIDAFRRILDEGRFQAARVLAVGDSLAEYRAAAELQIPFLAIIAAGVTDRFPSGVARLPDLRRISDHLDCA